MLGQQMHGIQNMKCENYSTIKQVAIFFFSGTGNSKAIATWLSQLSFQYEYECKIHDLSKKEVFSEIENLHESLIIIVSPTHGFNYPKITLDFIKKFPNGNNNVVLINTRAGVKIWKYITPGLSGIALWLSAMILKMKGYKICGQLSFDMPSNWLSIHPALREPSAHFILQRNYDKTVELAEFIFSNKRIYHSRRDIIQDLLISPIAIAYYFIGRLALSKTFYSNYSCSGCGLCIKRCPVNAIQSVNGRPFWTLKCENCMKCMNECPSHSIETAHGLVIVTSIIASTVVTTITDILLELNCFGKEFKFALWSLVFICLLVVLYKFQHYILSFKAASKLVAFSSLTHLKCWGRYICKIK